MFTFGEELACLAEGGDGLLAELHGGEHVLLGDLVGAGLDHGDVVGGAGDGEVQIGVLALLEGGVDDELAGLHVAADAHAGERGPRRARRPRVSAAEAPMT